MQGQGGPPFDQRRILVKGNRSELAGDQSDLRHRTGRTRCRLILGRLHSMSRKSCGSGNIET